MNNNILFNLALGEMLIGILIYLAENRVSKSEMRKALKNKRTKPSKSKTIQKDLKMKLK